MNGIRYKIIWDGKYRYHIEREDGFEIHFNSLKEQAEHHAVSLQLLNKMCDEVEHLKMKIALLSEKQHATDDGTI